MNRKEVMNFLSVKKKIEPAVTELGIVIPSFTSLMSLSFSLGHLLFLMSTRGTNVVAKFLWFFVFQNLRYFL